MVRMKSSLFVVLLGAASLASLAACSSPSGMSPTGGAAGTTGSAGTGAAAGTGGNAGTGAAAGTTGAAGTGGGAGTGAAAGTTGAAGTGAAAGTTGAAGTGAAAGTSGAAGTGAAAGTTGAAGTGGAVDAAKPSAGCNKPAAIAKGQFVATPIMGRSTWVRLPASYDPGKAYPLMFIYKGCGGAGVSSFGLENVAGNEAILASMDFGAGMDCYDTADGAKFVDLPVWDAHLAQIESNYCVDQNHVFAGGFSSGAWLVFFLGCQRGNLLRGIGTVAGGFKPTFLLGMPQCPGGPLSAFMVSDLSDHTNPFFDEDSDGDSVEIGLNHWLGVNGCTEKPWTMTNGTATGPDMKVCRSYAGCGRFPVELCLTTGVGHAAQESLSMPGMWNLFKMSLPK
jgi:poly(3-hydroxybutyrate) depolymerase